MLLNLGIFSVFFFLGLEHLHHGLTKPVVHGDIKSPNILIFTSRDDRKTAKVEIREILSLFFRITIDFFSFFHSDSRFWPLGRTGGDGRRRRWKVQLLMGCSWDHQSYAQIHEVRRLVLRSCFVGDLDGKASFQLPWLPHEGSRITHHPWCWLGQFSKSLLAFLLNNYLNFCASWRSVLWLRKQGLP